MNLSGLPRVPCCIRLVLYVSPLLETVEVRNLRFDVEQSKRRSTRVSAPSIAQKAAVPRKLAVDSADGQMGPFAARPKERLSGAVKTSVPALPFDGVC